MTFTFNFGSFLHDQSPAGNPCGCTGKNGKPKRLYPTFDLAAETAAYRFRQTGVHLNVYPCPEGNGFHLTSNQEQW